MNVSKSPKVSAFIEFHIKRNVQFLWSGWNEAFLQIQVVLDFVKRDINVGKIH